jgi:hypothetical protein
MLFLARDLSRGKYSRIGRMGCLLFTHCAFRARARARLHGNNKQITLSLLLLFCLPRHLKKTILADLGGGSTRPNVRPDRQIIAFGVRL